jgi:methylthioribose-1-phosphate isomerase
MTASSEPRRVDVETLRWRDDALELIDQRVLPRTVRYVTCRSAREVADAIAAMVVRGAPAIGCAAAYGVALAARAAHATAASRSQGLVDAHERLLASRPTAVNLRWALDRMRAVWQGACDSDLPERLLAEAHCIVQDDIAANLAMGSLGAALLPQACTVLTHCNAGALATAGHGTALGVIRSAAALGKDVRVIADETRPFLQGARLTAWELAQAGIPVTLIPDSAAGYLMSRGGIDAIIVGADRVASNGDVANKIGTYALAVLARRHGIPFYVACPVSTIDPALADGKGIPIEERAAAEMLGYGDVVWAPDGIEVRNPAFDVTPAELVTALITERGIACPPDRASIGALLAADR